MKIVKEGVGRFIECTPHEKLVGSRKYKSNGGKGRYELAEINH